MKKAEKMAVTKSVPVIDVQETSTLPQKLVRACEDWGCFRLINHGVPLPLMSDMKDVVRSLHDLPMEIKMRNYNPQQPSKGYTPPNRGGAFFESLSLYDHGSAAAVDTFCTQLDVSLQQREIITKYTSVVHDLAKLMGNKLLEGLGLNGEKFKQGIGQFKMNKYNYGPEAVGLLGAVMHSDAGFFTILQDDEDVNGLEAVDKTTGELISVDHVPGTLVFNVGDAGKVWSNGRFHNVKHQVQCYEANARVTIALFVLPAEDETVQVLPGLVDSDHPALYSPFNFDHYRSLRISTNSPSGEALDFFRSQPQLSN